MNEKLAAEGRPVVLRTQSDPWGGESPKRCDMCNVDYPTPSQQESHLIGKFHMENKKFFDRGLFGMIKKRKTIDRYNNKYEKIKKHCPEFKEGEPETSLEQVMRNLAKEKKRKTKLQVSAPRSGSSSDGPRTPQSGPGASANGQVQSQAQPSTVQSSQNRPPGDHNVSGFLSHINRGQPYFEETDEKKQHIVDNKAQPDVVCPVSCLYQMCWIANICDAVTEYPQRRLFVV